MARRISRQRALQIAQWQKTRITNKFIADNRKTEEHLARKVRGGDHKSIYVINRKYRGGSWRYLRDIMVKYNHLDYIFINSLAQLQGIRFKEGETLIVQYLINSDITVAKLVEIVEKYKLRVIIPIHDWYWCTEDQTFSTLTKDSVCCHMAYLMSNIDVRPAVRRLFAQAKILITPSHFLSEGHKRIFQEDLNITVVPHNDYPVRLSMLYVPQIVNGLVNIGVFTRQEPYKGAEILMHLVKGVRSHRGYGINYCMVGKTIPRYKESGFYEHARRYNIHCFLYLNKWGETYCYALTRAIAMGTPIFYNNIGAFRERLGDKEWHFQNTQSEANYPDVSGTVSRLGRCLDYVIKKQGTGRFPSDLSNTIKYHPFYNDLFGGRED